MQQLAVWMGIIVMLAALLLVAAHQLRRRSELPSGEIVYDDTSGKAGDVLTSRRYGLRGNLIT